MIKFPISSRWSRLESALATAGTYDEWRELAGQLDELSGANKWKASIDSEYFDANQISMRYRRMQDCLDNGDYEELLFTLNEGIHGNMAGMGSAALYSRARFGTKQLIVDFVELIASALRRLVDAPEAVISKEQKRNFFRRASHCYGRSALSLSGGAGLIYFHHGVVDALLAEDLLPRVISGASAGSWVCAQIGTLSDRELNGYFKNKRYDGRFFKFSELIRERSSQVVASARDDMIDSFVGDMSFEEAYEHTGRHINISIAPHEKHQKSRLMNAMTSPNVTIRSAVKASSSPSGLAPPVQLEAKDSRGRLKAYLPGRYWVDGSTADDLPFKRLARLYGVNHFIVSMINPAGLLANMEPGFSSQENIFRSVKRVYFSALKESVRNVRRFSSKTAITSSIDYMLSSFYQVLDQSYAGDIDITLSLKHLRLRNLLYQYANDGEIEAIYRGGLEASWPKLEQIRMASLISKEIDNCLERLEIDAIHQAGHDALLHHPLL
ncbi:putative esterase of the alpha-beta hydrolase superfamily [Spongiibacter sp. IMCC21906]|jgi:TAG lipase/steryl ester hydrolase/phospholipase A2/LPA acyltransferase|uniref:patatin-like phospholipase family protein n=1 Tax=Spongiibacter sp. IMCC21906 TaxID=1620392 RepID=UPI00062DE2C7|nr:patatin-like phospholipase family protein [Spongiibacter sp. IMCC21906]AKH68703.1 putative esterase of the alpha-beta hydrolase superfamily [Spongiibacter sp. IMCC21906]